MRRWSESGGALAPRGQVASAREVQLPCLTIRAPRLDKLRVSLSIRLSAGQMLASNEGFAPLVRNHKSVQAYSASTSQFIP